MPDDLPHLPIGAFVESSANNLGIGKVVGLDGTSATIEYFNASCAAGFHEHNLPRATLKKIALETHTRVFVKNDGLPSWTIATLVWHINSTARVILPGPHEENISASRIYVHSTNPACDPTFLLANHIVESTTYAQARRHFLTLMSQQQIAADGMHCLLSAAVDLEHHQVEVVRKVLRDPVPRYLLGDEVGLGKTIEAGLLIRQHIHDRPLQHQVLVIVPKALIHQWRYELNGRFGLHSELHKTVHVTEVSKLHKLEANFRPSMVVIDEAHQIAALYRGDALEASAFEAVRKFALAAPCLLMLTATPLLHNERDYLTMLHLLDPGIYQLDDIEGFKARVAQRQAIAEACFVLKPDTPNGFLLDALQQIQDHLPHDAIVSEVGAKLRARLEVEAEESDPERNKSIHQLRAHLSEVYKLHRRLLRNRRVGELKAVTPGRAGINKLVYSDPPLLKLFERLERWRDYVASETLSSDRNCADTATIAFAGLLAGCLELGCGMESLVRRRLAMSRPDESKGTAVRKSILLEHEQAILEELEACAAAVAKSAVRGNALADHIAKNLESTNHWIIFCTGPALADQLCALLKSRFGPEVVLRHNLDDTHWRKFHFNSGLTLLVCDARAEEGLNLQGREAVIVHFDLPFSPGRIEQRMGRLDRFSKGKPIRSVVLCADDSPWEENWLSLMHDGLDVFRESIASLQYSTAEWIKRGIAHSFRIGPDAWNDLTTQLAGEKGEAAQEKRRIAEQDAMDLMDLSMDTENSLTDRLRALEKPELIEAFSRALVTWSKQALNIKLSEDDKNRPGVFRLIFSEDWTLIPRGLFQTYFAGALDDSYHPPPWARDQRAASRSMSFSRRLAQERKSLVARYGENFLDALYNWTRRDDRGKCFALWRCRKAIPKKFEGAYIRLDFTIDADAAAALTIAGQTADPLAICREADSLLPPLHRGFWLDADHELVTDATLLNLLNAPLHPPSGPRQEGDFDLNSGRWSALAGDSVFRDWEARLRRSFQIAREVLPNLPDVKVHISRSKNAAEARLCNLEFQISSRLTVLPEELRAAEAAQFENELTWRKALVESISRPRTIIDSAGVIVLDRRSFQT